MVGRWVDGMGVLRADASDYERAFSQVERSVETRADGLVACSGLLLAES